MSRLRQFLSIIAAAGLSAAAMQAIAIEPGWYAPADNGEGIIVRCNQQDECAVLWATHGKAGEQLWLISTENCLRFAMVCDTEMAQTTGLWRGLGADTVIAEPTVTISLAADGDGLVVDWDARAQFPDSCFDIGSGGLLLRGCVGKKQFDTLAR